MTKQEYSKLEKELAKLPDLQSTDGQVGDIPAVCIFTPDSSATWVIWEYDPHDRLGFGLCDLGIGFPEIGYVSYDELKEVRGQFGLPVEVDSSVTSRFDGYKRAGVEVPSYMKGETKSPKQKLAKQAEIIYRGSTDDIWTGDKGKNVTVKSGRHGGFYYEVFVEGAGRKVFYGETAWINAAIHAGEYNWEAENAIREEVS